MVLADTSGICTFRNWIVCGPWLRFGSTGNSLELMLVFACTSFFSSSYIYNVLSKGFPLFHNVLSNYELSEECFSKTYQQFYLWKLENLLKVTHFMTFSQTDNFQPNACYIFAGTQILELNFPNKIWKIIQIAWIILLWILSWFNVGG